MSDKKTSISTFRVDYVDSNGEHKDIDLVRPVPFLSQEDGGGLAQLIEFQEVLLKIAVFEVAAVGALICNPHVLGIVRKMAAILPVVGRAKKGIDIDNLLAAGDYLQIGRIFFSEGYNGENSIPDNFLPSSIARINQMNFTGKLIEYSKEKIAMAVETLPVAKDPEPAKKVAPAEMPKIVPLLEIPLPVAIAK
jgi:hypothetical protein